MNRKQEYCRKLYGRAAEVERDLGRVAEQDYAEASGKYLIFPDGREEPILPEQYSALEEFCGQYGVTPEKMLECESNSVVVSNNFVTKIITPADYHVNCDELTIPDSLTQLRIMNCSSNGFSSLIIPETLTKLYTLNCGNNRLSGLIIPDKLSQLTSIGCSWNKLSSLTIPETLKQLTVLYCSYNNLATLTIPESVPLENLYCSVTELSEDTKQEFRDRGCEVHD